MHKKQTQKRRKGTLQAHARHLLVPHKGNQFRPHLIRLHGITVVLVIAVALQVAYGYATAGRLAVLGQVTSIDTTELVTETNQARATESLSPLVVNPALNKAAELKAGDMLEYDYWAHTSPAGVTPWHWLAQVGYVYQVAGENLAKNYPNAASTVDAWMNSETHRANIMNKNFTEVGFAVASGELEGKTTTLVVAYYGTPPGVTLAGEASGDGTVFAPEVAPGIGNPLGFFVTAVQSLSPATIIALVLLAVVGGVAIAAHRFRRKLPAAWRKSWRVHHGAYIAIGVVGLAVVVIFASGGGQI